MSDDTTGKDGVAMIPADAPARYEAAATWLFRLSGFVNGEAGAVAVKAVPASVLARLLTVAMTAGTDEANAECQRFADAVNADIEASERPLQ
ncbi:MAG: hypothetical protein OXC08_11820 [Thiotrichales bacterium]|nr:hypothetical protein [Thiotrichales bacterium]